jgi:hypothetical protein
VTGFVERAKKNGLPSQIADRGLSQLAASDQDWADKVGFMVAVAGLTLRIEDNPRSEKFAN